MVVLAVAVPVVELITELMQIQLVVMAADPL
jgi:hypothetical protein